MDKSVWFSIRNHVLRSKRTQTHVLRPKRTRWSCWNDIWTVVTKIWPFRPSDDVDYNHQQTRVWCRVWFFQKLNAVINCVTVTRTVWIRSVYRGDSPGKLVSTSRNSENRVRQHNFEASAKILSASKQIKFSCKISKSENSDCSLNTRLPESLKDSMAA